MLSICLTMLFSSYLFFAIHIGFLNTVFAVSYSSCYGQSDESAFQSQEKKLISCLTSDLDPNVRPVKLYNQTVDVLFGVATLAINDIDEKNHILHLKGWLFQVWTDPQLTWDKSSYDNIEDIRLPANQIWTPDIVLYYSQDSISLYDDSHSIVVVRNDGRVTYVPIDFNIKAYCPLDLSHFPYDSQSCTLAFGSWTNPASKVNITVWNNNTGGIWYKGNEWVVENHSLDRTEIDYGEEYGGSHALAIYTLKLQRNPVYYTFLYVLPAVLMSFVIVFLYLVPPESGERLTLGGALLIVLTILLLMLENHLPTEVDNPPLLLRFLLYDLFMLFIALLFTVMSLNFHHRDVRKGKVPSWMRKIFFGKLSYYLCMQGTVYSSLPTSDQSGVDGTFDEVTTSGASPRDLRVDQELQYNTPLPKSPTMAIEKTMDEIRRYLRICAAKATLPEPLQSHRETVINEWHFLGLVIDRLLFYIFGILNIILAIAMFAH